MSRPVIPGNTKRERLALLRSVGCPDALLTEADDRLRFLVTPVRVPAGWRVAAYLSATTARGIVNELRGGAR